MDRTDSGAISSDLEVDFLGRQEAAGSDHRPLHQRCTAHRPLPKCWTRSRHRAINILPKAAITVAVCDAVIPPQKKEHHRSSRCRSRRDQQRSIRMRFDLRRASVTGGSSRSGTRRPDDVADALQDSLGPLQPDLHDGGLRCSWFYEPDSSAGRYAWSDRQHVR